MRARSLIRGKNFSGRSDFLAALLMQCPNAEKRFFIGPFGESSLSGLAASVREELSLYGVPAPRCPWETLLSSKSYQTVASLSGGEQALLALACSTAPHLSIIGIDSALEQLDGERRAVALNFLQEQNRHDTVLIDNRLREAESDRFEVTDLPDRQSEFRIHLRGEIDRYQVSSPTIRLHKITFSYNGVAQIFCDASITLEPTNIYRLVGPNGVGKSTLLKLLCGVLSPSSGQLLLNNNPYSPFESGNKLVALASQNPDDQWVDVNLQSDFIAKWSATQRNPTISKEEATARLNSIAAGLGVPDPAKIHLLDYPRAQRKRLSWVWPLSGAMPWLALDEPTLGQDDEATRQIAQALELLTENGHGCILISHDERLFQLLRHKRLLIVDYQLELG